MPAKDQRVFVVPGYFGLRGQQVCALPDATDTEILEACNRDNPQKVAGGWHTVIRTEADCAKHLVDNVAVPGPCADCKGRIHFIALCM